MKVILADDLGICKGVENALSKATSLINEVSGTPIYFYGELVHNTEVVDYFKKKGVVVVERIEDIKVPGKVVIRAHGVSDKERMEIERRGNEIVDCTCPVVLKGQRLVRESDIPVVILGYKGHAEVESLLGSSVSTPSLVSSPEELDYLDKREYRGVVQTTFSLPLLKEILEKSREKGIEIKLANSICMASIQRRRGVEKLKGRVEAMVVVGALHSANTRELAQTASRLGIPSYLVENEESIPAQAFSYDIIGLTAGASTPLGQYIKVKKTLESQQNG